LPTKEFELSHNRYLMDSERLSKVYDLFNADIQGISPPSVKMSFKEFLGSPEISRQFLNKSMREKIWNPEEIEQLNLCKGAYDQLTPPLDLLGPKDLLFMANQVSDTDFVETQNVYLRFQHMKNLQPVDKVRYQMTLSGTLFDGTSAYITIKDAPCWFDILIPATSDHLTFCDQLEREFQTTVKSFYSEIRVRSFEAFIGKQWSDTPVWVARVITQNLYTMREAIKAARVRQFETFHDHDKSYSGYFRTIFKTYEINMGEWLVIRNATRIKPANPKTEYNNSVMTFEVSMFNPNNLHENAALGPQPWPTMPLILADPIKANRLMNVLNLNLAGVDKSKLGFISLMKDPSIVMTWDIETYNKANTQVPLWDDVNSEMFMTCYTIHYYHRTTPTMCIGFSTKDVDIEKYTQKHPELPALLVTCTDELDITTAHRLMISRFRPDYLAGFNDGFYDWPWMYKRVHPSLLLAWYKSMCYGKLGTMRCESNEEVVKLVDDINPIKIPGTDMVRKPQYIRTDGYLPLDLIIIMEKRYPKTEVGRSSSLNYYVKIEDIDSVKVDLSEDSPDVTIRNKKDGYAELRRIVSEGDRLEDAYFYCFHDAWLCQKLLHKINLIPEKRGYCKYAKVSLEDAIFRADGMRICNMREWGAEQQIAIRGAPVIFTERQSTHLSSGEKFGGAFVPRPIVGHHVEAPVGGLDFESLYPMLILVYNLCPSTIIRVLNTDGTYNIKATLLKAEQIGFHNLNEILFTYRNQNITVFTRRHQNIDKNGDPDGTCDPTRMGVYPWILLNLFKERLKKKKLRGYLESLKEEFNRILASLRFTDIVPSESGASANVSVDQDEGFQLLVTEVVQSMSKETNKKEVTSHIWETNDTISTYVNRKTKQMLEKLHSDQSKGKLLPDIYEYGCRFLTLAGDEKYCKSVSAFEDFVNYLEGVHAGVDIEQLTMKIMMNTFYGVLGKDVFPIFDLFLAASVTAMGQENIKYIREIAIKEQCVAVYGDTDSIYIAKEQTYFQDELDKRNSAQGDMRELIAAHYAYGEAVITKSIAEMKRIRDVINDILAKRHGCPYLRVAYEEVMYPAYFTSKKRYCGLAHVDAPVLNLRLANLSVKKLKKVVVIKGLDIIKQGHAQLTIETGRRLLAELMDPFSYSNLMRTPPVDTVLREIKRVNDEIDWNNMNQFILSKRYRRQKQNISVLEFAERMRIRNDPDTPVDGDRFTYVVTKPSALFNVYGRKIEERLSSKMEPVQYAIKKRLIIDRAYYMEKQLSNTLKLLVLYKFTDPELDAIEDDTKWYEILSKRGKDFIIGEIKTLLSSNDNAQFAPKFFRELNTSPDQKVQFILQTMYNRMSYGRAIVDVTSPVELAQLDAGEIIRLTEVNYDGQNTTRILLNLVSSVPELYSSVNMFKRDLHIIKLTLEKILPSVRNTYTEIYELVYAQRENADPNIIFSPAVIGIIETYVKLLNEIAEIRKQSIAHVAAINYIQLGI
jgi:DNA polymerase elongation subunit (family B)